jgi:hypothetical protein
LYNSELIKHYYQQSKKVVKEQIQKEDPTPKSSPLPSSQQKICKENIWSRPDGRPTARSKTAKLTKSNITHAKVV